MGALPQMDFSISPDRSVDRLPESNQSMAQFQDIWDLALESDPLLTAQSAVIEQRRLEKVSARNASRPNLDLVVSGAFSGIDNEDATEALQNTFDRDGKAWSVGVEFSMPWNRRKERADLSIAEKRLEKEELQYEDLKQSLYQEVRSSWRSLQAVHQSVEAAKLTVSLQEATFEREKGKYEQGMSAFRDVLEAQRDLDQARVRLLLSKYNKISADIELANLTGTIFQRHGISPELPKQN
jgi:outer membrane protein TolC